MKFSVAALSLLSAVALAAPAATTDCEEVAPTYPTKAPEAPKYEHKTEAPKATETPKYEHKPEAPKAPEAPKYEHKPEAPKAPEAPKYEHKPEAPKAPEAPKHEPKPEAPKYDAPAPKDCPKEEKKADFPIPFTSKFSIIATPDQVVENNATLVNAFTGGLPGALGFYDFGLNSELDIICYNIRLTGFRGDYQSPASTATHIHQSGFGLSGPPRISFPNPVEVEGDDNLRISVGCLSGPFLTGLSNNVTGPLNPEGVTQDTGIGFTIAMLEANPSAYNADVHSSLAVPGAVRGQFPAAPNVY